jgi:hypothetical protein
MPTSKPPTENGHTHVDIAKRMGRIIQQSYDDVPWVAVIAEQGWHREYDVQQKEEEP